MTFPRAESFTVDPARQGQRVGRALGSYAVEWAQLHGYRSIQFNAVVETNLVAVHLWQTLGFQILATVPEAFDHRDYGLVGLHNVPEISVQPARRCVDVVRNVDIPIPDIQGPGGFHHEDRSTFRR